MKPIHLLPAAALLTAAAAFAADDPAYDHATLALPRVDSPSKVGQYQDVVLQYTQQGTFKLQQFEELGKGKLYDIGTVRTVELRKSGTRPVDVYLLVSGELAYGCDTVGSARVHQRLQGNRFEVSISVLHRNPVSQPALCGTTGGGNPYRVVVPLETYGLAAGTYSYSVNGRVSGDFTLAANNKFANDCDPLKIGDCN